MFSRSSGGRGTISLAESQKGPFFSSSADLESRDFRGHPAPGIIERFIPSIASSIR